MKQREYLRQLYQRFGGDQERVIRAYAAGEEEGVVSRKSNSYRLTSLQYAKQMWVDAIDKGWLTSTGETGRSEIS